MAADNLADFVQEEANLADLVQEEAVALLWVWS